MTDDGELQLAPLQGFPAHLPLKLAVLSRLKDAILDGTLKPGTLLSENKLAASLAVSRTPVREALGVLEHDGLVTKLPGRKLIVSEAPAIEDILEIYDVRMTLEAEALRRIAPDNRELLDKLERCVARGKKALAAGDTDLLAQTNTEFHSALISALGNRRMEQLIDSIYDKISRFRLLSLNNKEWARHGVEEHARLVALLKEGQRAEAVKLLRQHLNRALVIVKNRFVEEEKQAHEPPP